MGAVSNFAGQVGRGLLRVMQAIGDIPIHCYRCRKESRFGAGELRSIYDIPRYAHSLHLFCDDCIEALYAEYQYHCNQCGKRHNLAAFPICVDCQKLQYPREAKRVESQNARAWELGLEATLTLPDWLTTVNDWKWSCWCCGGRFEALDHHIPIARGGGTTPENCFPICRRCNSMKGSFLPDELLQMGPRSPEAHQQLQAYRQRRWQLLSQQLPDLDQGEDQDADATL
jgi:hypothetical protein